LPDTFTSGGYGDATMTSAPRALRAADGGPLDPEPIIAALCAQFAVTTGAKRVARRRRLDTFDRRLLAAGLTLEHQSAASQERLMLGRTDGSTTVVVGVHDVRWPASADVLPTGPVRDAVAPVAGIRALTVISDERRRVRRLELRNAEGKTVARVELEESASKAAALVCLTVHPLRGYDDQARRVMRLLIGFGLRLVENGEPHPTDDVPSTVQSDRAVPASVLLTRVLTGFLVTMRANLPGLLDDVDTEFLHDFRVALRRTRSTLRLGRLVLPEEMRSRWEPAFKWVGDMTTPVRDLDVYELGLPMMAGWLAAAEPGDLDAFATHLRRRRTTDRHALVRGLRSARFRRLDSEWEQALARLADMPDDMAREHLSAGQLADRSISRAHERVTRSGAAISGDSPAEDLHSLRARCKELRYALEVFASVLDAGPRKRAVAELEALQDVLGRFQDAEVQRQSLRAFAEEMMIGETPAAAMLAMGELIGHLDAEQDRARHNFDSAFTHFVRPSSSRRINRLGGAE